MLKLFCAIVGVSGSSFHVDIDENETVGDLKDAIKDKKPLTITCEADQLQLFLAKTTDGAWLTENDVKKGVKDTSGLTPLEFANVPLNLDDLSEEEVRVQLTKDDFKAGNGPVHVLVAVPNHVRVNIGGTSSRALKYMPRYKRWTINGQCFVPPILVVIAIIILADGENSTDEKGCLIAPGRSRIVCLIIGLGIVVVVLLLLWISKFDNVIEEVKAETPFQAQRQEMTDLIFVGEARHQELTELLLPATEAQRQPRQQP